MDIYFYSLAYVHRMGRWMDPRVKNNNPLGPQKTISRDILEE